MRILLVGNYVLDTRAAMLRYTEMLSRNLQARGHMVELIRPRAVLGGWTNGPVLRRLLGYADKFLLFPLKLSSAAQGFDLVHVCDQQNAVYLRHTGGVPASITCHDLLAISAAEAKFPQQRVSAIFRARQRKVLRHLQEAQSVVCVSWKTARELSAMREGAVLRQRADQRRVVIPNAVEVNTAAISPERVTALRSRIGLRDEERYLLHVGGQQWYKNRPGALRIFRMVRERADNGLKLVMAGAPLTPELREFAAANLPQGSVIEVHTPPDEDLWALYAGAVALLFPSLYEGFGWPIAEAQSCGCPVIASNRAPMTEVAGPAALYIDPRDEAGAAETITAKLKGLESLRAVGFENAKRFQPDVVFEAYESFFRGVLRVRRVTDVVIAANEAETAAGNLREH
jgi:glycosyltransferase involved in cell wall biosynthesis